MQKTLQISDKGLTALQNNRVNDPDLKLAMHNLQDGVMPSKDIGSTLLKMKYADLIKHN